MFKRFLCLTLSLFLLFSLVGCGDAASVQPAFDSDARSGKSSASVENDTYRLEFDSVTGGVTLTELATDRVWGTSPLDEETEETTEEQQDEEFVMPVKKHDLTQSVLNVSYREVESDSRDTVNSYDGAMLSGRVICRKMKNATGFTVEYYFDNQEFMVPVNFILKDDYVSVSVDPTRIQESKYLITDISLAPFWCSTPNDSADSYLFVPSGSGALTSVASASQQGATYSEQVYGEDLAMEKFYDASNKKAVSLPVYGVKNGDVGSFAVIESGAETAWIEAVVGSTSYTHTTVYSKFQLRGYTEHMARIMTSEKKSYIFTDEMITSNISVRFYPLADGNASYNGMADIYRDYLVNECGLTKTKEEKTLNLNFYGGSLITKSFLGIPYNTVYPTTTISQVSDIVSEISEAVDDDFSVNLTGFGSTGVDIGKIAGGYKISDKLGSVSDLKKLSAFCGENSLDLYMDFDIVNYNTSGNGFSTFTDAIMTSGNQKKPSYIINKETAAPIESTLYRQLTPYAFDEAVTKLIKKTAKWNLTGVSLASLSCNTYSDYADDSSTDYYAKSNFGATAAKAISKIKDNGSKFMATEANLYAALLADVIVDTPTYSSQENIFVEDVPFYSMVFKGYVPMVTESLTTTNNVSRTFLSAVEGGIGLNYSLINQWDNSLIDAYQPYFYSTLYSSVKDDIIANSEHLSDYYSKIKGATITSNSIIASGVHCTVFDNGTTVYVNYNNTAAETPAGAVDALDFVVLEGVS